MSDVKVDVKAAKTSTKEKDAGKTKRVASRPAPAEEKDAKKNDVKKPATAKEAKVETEELLSIIEKSVSEVANKDIKSNRTQRLEAINVDVNQQVLCTSIVFGKLIYKSSKTSAKFKWPEFGTTEWVPFYELQTMNNDNSTYLNKPCIIINDPNVVAYFHLNDVYARVAKTHMLESAIEQKNLDQVREIMSEAVRHGLRDIVIAKLRKMRQEKVLNDVDIMRILSEEYDIDLEI